MSIPKIPLIFLFFYRQYFVKQEKNTKICWCFSLFLQYLYSAVKGVVVVVVVTGA